jgi:hypothetical protein
MSALLNSEEFRQRRAEAQDWNQQLRKKTFEVVEHLKRQGCVAETQLQTELVESSVELCQVGIEHTHGLRWRKNSVESLKTEDRISEEFCGALPSGH